MRLEALLAYRGDHRALHRLSLAHWWQDAGQAARQHRLAGAGRADDVEGGEAVGQVYLDGDRRGLDTDGGTGVCMVASDMGPLP